MKKKWTKQSVIAIAKTCSDYKDFYDKYENTAYYAAYYRFKILPEIIKLLGEPNARPNYYFKGESKSRIILEGLLGIELKKTRNISDLQTKTGQNLELDGYNKKSKIAFEYNGEHHYNKNDFVYKKRKSKNTWEIQQENDQIKQKYCKKNKITLIIIPQHKNLKFNSLYTYIISILDTMNIKYKKNIDTETLKLTVNKVDEYRS